jgi:chemotaxis protein MotB
MSELRLRKHEEVDAEGSWAISYGDMITVLLAFFVMFFSVDFEKENEELINSSLIDSLSSTNVLTNMKFSNKEMLQGLDVESGMEIKQLDKDNILVFFRGKSFFKSGKTEILKDKLSLILNFSQKILPFLGEYKVVVQSYTDSSPVSKGRRYRDNTELAMLRSLTVMRSLINSGVDSDRIEITGKGILNERVLGHMGINETEDEVIVKNMQRTVSFVLRRSPI